MHRMRSAAVSSLQSYALPLTAFAVIFFLALAFFSSAEKKSSFTSVEAQFTEVSAGGMQIVPASCPSDPHYEGQCSGATSPGRCAVYASTYSIGKGQSTVLSWSSPPDLGGSNHPFVSATLTGFSGDAGMTGSMTVTPARTTTYTYRPKYSGVLTLMNCDATITVGNFSCPAGQHLDPNGANGNVCICDATGDLPVGGVCVSLSCPVGQHLSGNACVCDITNVAPVGGVCSICPAGQHAVGTLCICDDTGLPSDTSGQCTGQVCPSGFQFDPGTGQCVRISQCVLPRACADSTHVLNQCTGATIDCAAINGVGWMCQNGTCVPPPPPIASISAVPSLLPPNRTTNIAWSSTNTASCSVRGSNGDGPWVRRTDSQTSSPITSQVVYTLTCLGLDGSTITRTATVNIIPNWVEQ